MPSLHLSAPGQSPRVYHLHKTLTSLGSSAECDVQIADGLVAETSAHIQFDGQVYTIVSHQKKSDITIHGKGRKKHKLSHQDTFALGSTQIRFLIVDEVEDRELEQPEVSTVAGYQRMVEFSNALMQECKLSELLEKLMDAVVDISSADKGFLILMRGDELDIKVARNLKRENIADAISQLSDSIVAKVVETQKPVLVSDAASDNEFAGAKSVLKLKLSSVICIPLLQRGTLLGILYVGNESITHLMTEDTLKACTIFASQASLIMANAIAMQELEFSNETLHQRIEAMRFGTIIGTSKKMQAIFAKVDKVAQTDISVLITGETGTGKELVAREIHQRSSRVDEAFVVINCGAIPENLLESELFGHVKGSFTGAVSDKIGKFQAADKGTLFLDEIGEMPHALQVKLLRAIQERVIVPVGSNKPKHVDIRLIAATHRDLEEAIEAGSFREDLFYRINVINLQLPPLRERDDDTLVIARFLLGRYIAEFDSAVKGFAPDATRSIRKYPWPGNIREMENRIKKAIVLSETSMISSSDLDLVDSVLPDILPLSEAKDNFQRDYINQVLTLNEGNRTKTARDLGVDPRTIFRHLEKDA